MEITIKQTTEIKKEIEVPSYWKTKYNFYRVYERDGNTLFDVINIWDNIKEITFSSGESAHKLPFDRVDIATKNDFDGAFNRLLDVLDIIINEEDKSCGSDSFWHLKKQLLPLNEI